MKPMVGTAIVGNGRILTEINGSGELYRLFWPSIDTYQQVHHTWPTVLSPIFGDRAVRLDDENLWEIAQDYLNDTNILITEAKSRRGNFRATTLDFVVPDRDIMVRVFEFSNRSEESVPLTVLYYGSWHINEGNLNNGTSFDDNSDILFHYKRDTWLAVAGGSGPAAYQCGWCEDNSYSGMLNGSRLSMAPDGCQAWDLGLLEPAQSRSVAIYLAAGHNRAEAEENIFYARQQGWDGLLKETSEHWVTYLRQANDLPLPGEIKRIYLRSVMVLKLLMNRESGGIIAAPEFDETYRSSGGYGYCWPRDGAFIAQAMLKAGYHEYTRAFYHWAANCQNLDGSWSQRYYSDGALAPGWGDQIDETGSVLWGIWEYYQETKNKNFLADMWPTVDKAVGFILDFMEDGSGLPGLSWDLWEERFGVHAYSCAAVCAGLRGAGQIAGATGRTELADKWLAIAARLNEKIKEYFWDADVARYLRTGWLSVHYDEFARRQSGGERVRELAGPKGQITHLVFGDDRADISLLGLAVPFEVLSPADEGMQKTFEHLVKCLTNPDVGGIHRYVGDNYIGGNPWVLTTLWLGLFEAILGKWDAAAGRLDWAVLHRTALGFLPEQVDRHHGHAAWVVPLAWSHAMYILLVNFLSQANKVKLTSDGAFFSI
ncbi:MAG: glycoside hydrolase family 15 protein [Thermincola sp.]|jgi:oligosaccharide amylase|nr:glycoside hydrolase family 15 protein [Thermincola sp.]MDT3704698.1 glycoside hydrolase family 15 protein [Thermincola sp.]